MRELRIIFTVGTNFQILQTTGLTMKEIATLIEEYKQGYLSAKDRRYIVDKMTGGQTLKGAVIMLIKRDRKRRGAK